MSTFEYHVSIQMACWRIADHFCTHSSNRTIKAGIEVYYVRQNISHRECIRSTFNLDVTRTSSFVLRKWASAFCCLKTSKTSIGELRILMLAPYLQENCERSRDWTHLGEEGNSPRLLTELAGSHAQGVIAVDLLNRQTLSQGRLVDDDALRTHRHATDNKEILYSKGHSQELFVVESSHLMASACQNLCGFVQNKLHTLKAFCITVASNLSCICIYGSPPSSATRNLSSLQGSKISSRTDCRVSMNFVMLELSTTPSTPETRSHTRHHISFSLCVIFSVQSHIVMLALLTDQVYSIHNAVVSTSYARAPAGHFPLRFLGWSDNISGDKCNLTRMIAQLWSSPVDCLQ